MYGRNGSMKTVPGKRDEVVAILLRASEALRAAGCHLYVVSVPADDPELIWVYEAWESKEHHRASLQLPETRAAIAEAMPMLTGEFSSQELTVIGGLGIEVGQ